MFIVFHKLVIRQTLPDDCILIEFSANWLIEFEHLQRLKLITIKDLFLSGEIRAS